MPRKHYIFRNLDLSTKIFIILGPILLFAVILLIYINYHYQEDMILQQAQSIAENQANMLKASLLNQMEETNRVKDSFLLQVSGIGQVDHLEVHFETDSLHLNPEYLTTERLERLRTREKNLRKEEASYLQTVISPESTLIYIHCTLNIHPDRSLRMSEWWTPYMLSRCEELQMIKPYIADASCQRCHDVKKGTVLGKAYMNISLNNTIGAIQATEIRTIIILLTAFGIGAFFIILMLNRFVDMPVNNLIHATKQISAGNFDIKMKDVFGSDEIGSLAKSFREMQDDLKAAREELIRKERLYMVGQMASGIIHDFRGPMNMIAMCVEFLRKDQGLSEQKKIEYFSRVRIAIDQMKRMTQEVLEYSRGEITANIREIDLSSFVDNIRALMSSEMERKKIHFEIVQTYNGTVFMDPDRIYRGLINLFNNAEDAMPKGGCLVLNIDRQEGSLILSLKDSGEGIPEAIRSTIFEPFVTMGKTYGTGLGLAITKKIVDEHNGTIAFETERGKGTTFRISIPLNLSASAPETTLTSGT